MKLHHKILGPESGETLIILHGLFGSLDNWMTLAKLWAEEYHVIVVDQRNHGRSPHSEEFSYELMADDLLELVYDLRVTGFHLLGHSMGGKAAMLFAQRHPELLYSLIVADIAPHGYPPHHNHILEAMTTATPEILTSRSRADAHLAQFIPENGTRQFLLKNLYWKEKGQLDWRMNIAVLAREIDFILGELELESIDVPTLFLRGTLSKYIQDKDFPAIRNLFEQVSFVDFVGAGHWLHAEQPERMLEVVKEFID